MGRKKLERFADNDKADNLLQEGKPLFTQIKGKWNEAFFKRAQPLVLELACGRGEYTVGLAQAYPERNFVGIDLKGSRLWKGSQFAITHHLENVGFLRTQIQNVDLFFDENEVDEIWLTFPDPRPKDRDERRRLSNPRFMAMYRKMLKPEGIFHLKTDNTGFFDYTLEVLQNERIKDLQYTYDLYESPLNALHHGIKTHYEALFYEQGHKIKYLQFRFAQ